MQKLLSLPPNLVKYFYEVEEKTSKEWFCASDPPDCRIGSGGGTSWILKESWDNDQTSKDFSNWLKNEKRIIINGGGQSRRLPAYAPSGKILTPIPVFRWERGQKIDQNLLDLQIPLYEKILNKAPGHLNTLIASGDIYIRTEGKIKNLPDADVVCYGIWVDPELASKHGVFVCERNNPEELLYMLQKPSCSQLQKLSQENLYLMDIGIWVLSDRAVDLLIKRSGYNIDKEGRLVAPENPEFYDLYSDFGLNLGTHTNSKDTELNKLTVAICPLRKGEFYHFGTNKELISSTVTIQNRVMDQRSILHKDSKPHPSMFIQNADIKIRLYPDQRNLWIENSFIGKGWKIQSEHIITGIPVNDWNLNLPKGVCLDIIPINNEEYCIRFYGFYDDFKGSINSKETKWLGNSFSQWLLEHNLVFSQMEFPMNTDIQSAKIFPVMKKKEINEDFLNWIIHPSKNKKYAQLWKSYKKISANEIIDKSNLKRLYQQREKYRNYNISQLHKNYKKSVFYQVDLDDIAKRVAKNGIELPTMLKSEDPFLQMREYMFQAKVKQYLNRNYKKEEQQAFKILQNTIIQTLGCQNLQPKLNVFQDQIVWGRSPVRIDVAGGWSDTPPYSLIHGGAVVNMAIELNGQPPLQVYIKPSKEYKIILRSIDVGTREDITSYDEISQYNQVGSAFSIPKAALFLSGFHPSFSTESFNSLHEQLKAFGAGIEISTLAAIPKGSGLGTSSILASTVLGALSDFCGFDWSQNEISHRTLVLEQLLTTGGGWQDQYGGVLPGIKLLSTNSGSNQTPEIKWAPDFLFTRPENKATMLLYYTGITRTAKNILAEIVRGMFLNNSVNTAILKDIKLHALDTFDVLQRGNFDAFSDCVNLTWEQKQLLDKDTNPPEVRKLINSFKDYTAALSIPGAGGGGYIYIIAKDPEAAAKIRIILNENPPNKNARFVNMNLSLTGFQVTRS
ncbi:MAG: bifunctional fucokinase/fucose-1-phosphate guanylyltransferase [Bacteroidota bacterium]